MIDNHLPKNVMGGGGTPNPKKLMKELKKHYWRAFLVLIKAYKRYYLGAWIIKLPFYRLTSNQHQFIKWQAKRDERLEFLHNALKTFKFLSTFDEESKKWLNSPEFKAKYLDTKHPYPPLLNPDSVDYKSIPAELAWDINLPLPRKYNMIYIYAHGSGVVKVQQMMVEHWKLSICFIPFDDAKSNFIFAYNFLKRNRDCIIQFDKEYKDTNFSKFLALIDKKVTFFIQVRDPIELLRHVLARSGRWWDYENIRHKTIDFKSKIEETLPSFTNSSFNKNLEPLKTENYPTMFHIKAHLTRLKNNSEYVFLDIKELNSDDIIFKINQIAKKFSFSPLLEHQKKSLQSNVFEGSQYLFFPLYFYANSNDLLKHTANRVNKLDNFKITLTHPTYSEDDFDLYEEILGRKNEHYGIYISKRELLAFRENKILYKATCKYLKNFMEKLQARFEQEDNATLKIDDILQYLKRTPKARKNVSKIIKDDVAIIKKYRPDIVESWKYYNEFEKMCAELDKKE